MKLFIIPRMHLYPVLILHSCGPYFPSFSLQGFGNLWTFHNILFIDKEEPFGLPHFAYTFSCSFLTSHCWTDESNGWGYPALGGPLMVMDISIRRWSKCLQVIICYSSHLSLCLSCLDFRDNQFIFLNLILYNSLMWTSKLLDSWCDAPILELYQLVIIIPIKINRLSLLIWTFTLLNYFCVPTMKIFHHEKHCLKLESDDFKKKKKQKEKKEGKI